MVRSKCVPVGRSEKAFSSAGTENNVPLEGEVNHPLGPDPVSVTLGDTA